MCVYAFGCCKSNFFGARVEGRGKANVEE